MASPTAAESSSQALSVLGVGLTSPFGMTARDHAFFLRGRLRPIMPPPFLDAEGEAVSAAYCRWLGAQLSVPDRMERMVYSALGDAVEPWLDHYESGWDVALVVESPRVGLDDTALTAVRSAVQTILAGKRANFSVHRGAAGCQRALVALASRLGSGESSIGCVIAVDSFVCAEVLAEAARTPIVWRPPITPLSEAAGALVLVDDRRRPAKNKPIGRLLYSAAVHGLASDVNDEVIDGIALTHLLRGIPDYGGAFPVVFGPRSSDALRTRDWHLASARNARRFCEPYAMHDAEANVGRVGAAAGLLHLAYGLASLQYQTAHPTLSRAVTALSWAVSRDGWRGVTVLQGGLS